MLYVPRVVYISAVWYAKEAVSGGRNDLWTKAPVTHGPSIPRVNHRLFAAGRKNVNMGWGAFQSVISPSSVILGAPAHLTVREAGKRFLVIRPRIETISCMNRYAKSDGLP